MAKDKTKDKKDGELMIPVEQFRRTRDQIITTLNDLQGNLQSVQSGLQNMMTVYLRHSQSVLAGGSGAFEPLATDGQLRLPVITAEDAPQPEKKRGRPKKDKKDKDPNAPKRPLTAAFLYSQQARAIVKQDLEKQLGPGEKLEGNAVNMELNRRWAEMPEDEKDLWKESYRDSMAIYQNEVAEYKKQKGIQHDATAIDGEIDDAEAGTIPSDLEASSSDDSDEDSPTRPKAPTPPATTPKSKRQKAAKTNGVAPTPILPATTMRSTVPVPIPSVNRATSVKPAGTASPAVENGKAKPKKNKDKEPSPEESKKKRSRRSAVEEDESAAAQEPPKKKRDHRKKKDATS